MSEQEQPPAPTQAVTKFEERVAKFRDTWQKVLPMVSQMIPKHLAAERIFSVALAARTRNPELMECTDVSVLRGIIKGAQLGLDVSGIGGKGYLIPYKNKNTGKLEAEFVPGYRGLMELARRTGQIGAMYGRCVYEGEDFEWVDGLNPVLVHRPAMASTDDSRVSGAWIVAVWTNGFRQFEVMNRYQIDKVRAKAPGNQSPYSGWVTSYPQMALKTVIRRICKLLPDSEELARALDVEDRMESGQDPVIDVDLGDEQPEAETRTEKTKKQMKKATEEPT